MQGIVSVPQLLWSVNTRSKHAYGTTCSRWVFPTSPSSRNASAQNQAVCGSAPVDPACPPLLSCAPPVVPAHPSGTATPRGRAGRASEVPSVSSWVLRVAPALAAAAPPPPPPLLGCCAATSGAAAAAAACLLLGQRRTRRHGAGFFCIANASGASKPGSVGGAPTMKAACCA